MWKELPGIGAMIGYGAMWQRLQDDHGLALSREAVRMVLQLIDPEGVDERRRQKLKRRNYSNSGPNHMWHIDGYDKLKPFGFCIHGCIDRYSRIILWLEVGKSNDDPAVVAKCFWIAFKRYQVSHILYVRMVAQRMCTLLGFRGTSDVMVRMTLVETNHFFLRNQQQIKGFRPGGVFLERDALDGGSITLKISEMKACTLMEMCSIGSACDICTCPY